MENNSSSSQESPKPVVTTGDFLAWHTKLGDELDLVAKGLQIELDADPTLVDDPEFARRMNEAKGQIDLFNRVSNDFSNHTVESVAASIIERAQEEE